MTDYGYPDGAVFYRRLDRRFPRVVSGRGVYLFDEDGRRYLDASGGALVANVGHGVEEIAEAVGRQAREVAYASGLHFTNGPVEELAAELAEVMPEPLGFCYFLSSGSEAVEASVKLARQYWVERGRPEKWKVVTRVPSYHGNTLAALSLSGREHYRVLYGPLLTAFPRIPAPDEYRHPGCDACTGEALERAIEEAGPETVAAFVAEPVIGSSLGAMVPRADYYRRVREVCDRHDVLFVADEVMAGMGRTGRWFSFEHFGVVPDVAVIGKGLSGGYAPLSAVLASRPVVEAIARGSGAFGHAQTWSNTPVAAAAGVATVRYLKKHGLVARAAEMEAPFFAALARLREHEAVGDVRGRGLMAGVELVADRATRRPFARAERVAERVAEAAMRNGLVVWTNTGHVDGEGDIVMLGPPLTITTDEIDELVGKLSTALEETEKTGHG
jgi:adenosylmethionine-8-amino-7-oxononanoate aminotransferase